MCPIIENYSERSSSSQEHKKEVINKLNVRMAEWFVAALTYSEKTTC